MNTIRLQSRYGVKTTLEPLSERGENTYLFKSNALYLRASMSEDNEITWIDPEGGPMISVGYTVPEIGSKVSSIKHEENLGYIITFE